MTSLHSKPLALKNVTVTDSFWRTEQELVRTAVIPYQWNALNDNVPGAAPSYCMHNFKAAAAQNKRKDTHHDQCASHLMLNMFLYLLYDTHQLLINVGASFDNDQLL